MITALASIRIIANTPLAAILCFFLSGRASVKLRNTMKNGKEQSMEFTASVLKPAARGSLLVCALLLGHSVMAKPALNKAIKQAVPIDAQDNDQSESDERSAKKVRSPSPPLVIKNTARLAQTLKHLRCEGGSFDSNGQPNVLNDEFMQTVTQAKARQSKSGLPPQGREPDPSFDDTPVMIEVWPGIYSTLRAAGGQGFYIEWQIYSRQSLEPLLKAIAARGWKLKRVPLAELESDFGNAVTDMLTAAHVQERPLEDGSGRTANLTLIEQSFSINMRDIPNLNELTLLCSYSPRKNAP
jgi:hypothetical protein